MNKFLHLLFLLLLFLLIFFIINKFYKKKNSLDVLKGQTLQTTETITSLNGLYSLKILTKKSSTNTDINILCVVNSDDRIIWELVPENGMSSNKPNYDESIPQTALGGAASHQFNIGSSIKLIKNIDTSTGLYNVYIEGDNSSSKRIKIAESQPDFNHNLFIDNDGILKLTCSSGNILLSEPLLYKLTMTGTRFNCGIGGGGGYTIIGARIPDEIMSKYPKYRRMADLIHSYNTYPKLPGSNDINIDASVTLTNWIIRKSVARNVNFDRAWGATNNGCSLWVNKTLNNEPLYGTSTNFGIGSDWTTPTQEVTCDFSYVVTYVGSDVTFVGNDSGSGARDGVTVYRSCTDADWAVVDWRMKQYSILKNISMFEDNLATPVTFSVKDTTDINVFNNWTSLIKTCKILGKINENTLYTDKYGPIRLNRSFSGVGLGDTLSFIHSSQVPFSSLKTINDTYSYKIFYYDIYGYFNTSFYYCNIQNKVPIDPNLPIYSLAETPLTSKYTVYNKPNSNFTQITEQKRKVFDISNENFHFGSFFHWDGYFINNSELSILSPEFSLTIKIEGVNEVIAYYGKTWNSNFSLHGIIKNLSINPKYINKIIFSNNKADELIMTLQLCGYVKSQIRIVNSTLSNVLGYRGSANGWGYKNTEFLPSSFIRDIPQNNITSEHYITNIRWKQRGVVSITYRKFNSEDEVFIDKPYSGQNDLFSLVPIDTRPVKTDNSDKNYGLVGIYTLVNTAFSWFCVNGLTTVYRDTRIPFELDNPYFYRIYQDDMNFDNNMSLFGVQSNNKLTYYGYPDAGLNYVNPVTNVNLSNFRSTKVIPIGMYISSNIPWVINNYFLSYQPSDIGYLNNFGMSGSGDSNYGWSGVTPTLSVNNDNAKPGVLVKISSIKYF